MHINWQYIIPLNKWKTFVEKKKSVIVFLSEKAPDCQDAEPVNAHPSKE